MSTMDQAASADGTAASTATPVARGAGVRWKRFGGMLALTGAATAGLIGLTAQGVLAANFSLSGMPFVVTATKLHGDGFAQFAVMDSTISGGEKPVKGSDVKFPDGEPDKVLIVSAIDHADLTKLCQSVDLGGAFLKITAGDAKDHVTAESLVVDSDLISGNASFDHINIGQDASTFTQVPDPDHKGEYIAGGQGVFGQQARTIDILDLRQNNYSTTAATFRLPHLRMTFDSTGC